MKAEKPFFNNLFRSQHCMASQRAMWWLHSRHLNQYTKLLMRYATVNIVCRNKRQRNGRNLCDNYVRNDELSSKMSWVGCLTDSGLPVTRYMKVKRTGITEILRRIWLFSANKIKSSESGSKQPTQLIIAAHNCHKGVRFHSNLASGNLMHFRPCGFKTIKRNN